MMKLANTADVSDALLKKLEQVSVCTATQALIDIGFHNTYMKGIIPLHLPEGKSCVAGRAVTLRFIPLREDMVKLQYEQLAESPHRSALESIRPNDILVMDTGGFRDTGVVGDIFTRRLRYLGGRAILVDGCVRDLIRIRMLDVPVYARGVHGGAIPRSLMSADFNEPVRCGGVSVIPGDIILADADGVIAIPPQAVEEVIRVCSEHDELLETWIRMKLEEGASLHTHYPPGEEAMKDYEMWKSKQTAK
jgi:regulator of RNase E activity RraA